MSIFVLGINHKTAPITVREKVYFALEKLPLYLQDLLNRGGTQEAVLLSTCNRSELYCETDDISTVRDWFCDQATLSRAELDFALYAFSDREAVQHIIQVACGLDSMIVGEPQILGQMKEAFSESCTAGAVGPIFNRLFQQIFSIAKEIRTSTSIGACPVSVASASVHFAKQQVQHFSQAKVLLIGAGDTTRLLLRYLQPHLQKSITLINRSIENAVAMLDALNGQDTVKVYGLDQLQQSLQTADIVFSATGSTLPIVTKDIVAKAMQARQNKPLILIDMAVPRDVDPNVNSLPDVQLFCVDDLKTIIEQNRQGREHAANKAHEMIAAKSRDIIADLASIDKVSATIRAYRGQVQSICNAELHKAKQQLQQGTDPDKVLEIFAHSYTKKLLHEPSVQLRQAGAEGRFDLLKLAKQLFAIPDKETECL